jgi:hypothetical protein
MKVFKCDGHRFSDGVKCPNETKYEGENKCPENWITIDGTIVNNKKERGLIKAGGTFHFCSWECLYLYLFKNTSKL